MRKSETKRKATGHPLYVTWKNMRWRCNSKNSTDYKWYGGRGIKICKEWDDFWTFAYDMGEKPDNAFSIDRIDNDKGYSPSNCKWSSKLDQVINSRIKENRKGKLKGTIQVNASKINPWRARIMIHRQAYHIGYYKTEKYAHAAYCSVFKEWYGFDSYGIQNE